MRPAGHRELHPGEVIVVDEAAATANQDLAALMRAAQNRGARIILTGDTKQLDAPGQGGGMRLIEQAHGAHQLTEVHRFHEPWEGPASLRLRDGDTSVDAEYAGHGRTREGTQDEMRREAVDGWLADHVGGKQTLLVSSDNATAAELAAQARDRLIGLGRVADRADIVLGRDGNEASTGDLVIARANAKDIDAGGEPLANRHVLILDGWTGDGDSRQATVRRQTADGWTAPFTVPASYLERDGQLGYAGNTHIAQARTVDTCHEIVTDATVSESQYVGATRGRELNMRYTVTNRPGQADLRAEPAPAEGGKEPPVIDTGEMVRLAAMEHSGVELTATETIRAAQDEQERMPFLVDVLRAATKDANDAAVDEILRTRLSEHDYQRYQADHERGLLHQRVREMQLAGHDPAELLTRATERDMEGARSVAGVLHGRLGRIEQDESSSMNSDRCRHRARPVLVRERSCARARAATGELARQAAVAADERAQALGEQAAADPPDWALDIFGDVPDDPQERQHWVDGAAAVASYRELTGHDDAEHAIGEAPAASNAEWRASWRHAAQAAGLERTKVADREATDGELHADRMAGQRAEQQAPPDVADELREMQGAVSRPGNSRRTVRRILSGPRLMRAWRPWCRTGRPNSTPSSSSASHGMPGTRPGRRPRGARLTSWPGGGSSNPSPSLSRNPECTAPNWAAARCRPERAASAASSRRTCRWTTTSQTPTWRSSGPSVSGAPGPGSPSPRSTSLKWACSARQSGRHESTPPGTLPRRGALVLPCGYDTLRTRATHPRAPPHGSR